MSVAFVYHYFPHYRSGVIGEICKVFPDASFYGQAIDGDEGIPCYQFESGCLVHTPVLRIGKYLLQGGLSRPCFSPKIKCVVFLANPNFLSTWIWAPLARIAGKRVVFWGHGYFSSTLGIRNLIRAAFFRLAHAFYTYGYRAKVHAKSFGFPPESIYVGFNSLDYRKQVELRQALKARSSSRRSARWQVTCVSRLTNKCRYDLLIEALALASGESEFEFELNIIGDGPERERLEKLAIDHRVAITFHGAIYDEARVSELIWRSDVVVSPGKVGLTAMHSLMFGVPVITHGDFEFQMPEVEAVVEGITGLFFRRGSAESLAHALIKSIALFRDKSAVRENCFRVIDEVYNPSNQVVAMKAAIEGKPAVEGDAMWKLFGASPWKC